MNVCLSKFIIAHAQILVKDKNMCFLVKRNTNSRELV